MQCAMQCNAKAAHHVIGVAPAPNSASCGKVCRITGLSIAKHLLVNFLDPTHEIGWHCAFDLLKSVDEQL
jgi:hypothetical protein